MNTSMDEKSSEALVMSNPAIAKLVEFAKSKRFITWDDVIEYLGQEFVNSDELMEPVLKQLKDINREPVETDIVGVDDVPEDELVDEDDDGIMLDDEDDDVGGDGKQRGRKDIQLPEPEIAPVDERRGEGLGVRAPDHQRDVLQQVAHADGRDQYGQGGCLAQGPVGEALDRHAQHGTEHHGQQDRKHRGNSPVLQAAERDIRADHDDVAVGKVQHFRDAVNHRVAQGYDGVDTAQTQSID